MLYIILDKPHRDEFLIWIAAISEPYFFSHMKSCGIFLHGYIAGLSS